jgi:hypothetical protein
MQSLASAPGLPRALRRAVVAPRAHPAGPRLRIAPVAVLSPQRPQGAFGDEPADAAALARAKRAIEAVFLGAGDREALLSMPVARLRCARNRPRGGSASRGVRRAAAADLADARTGPPPCRPPPRRVTGRRYLRLTRPRGRGPAAAPRAAHQPPRTAPAHFFVPFAGAVRGVATYSINKL